MQCVKVDWRVVQRIGYKSYLLGQLRKCEYGLNIKGCEGIIIDFSWCCGYEG